MRQRITFLHAPRDAIDPTTLQVTDSSLQGPVLPAVREDRLTLALDELPDELRQVLQKGDELHIRWVSPHAYDTISPLYARLPPGFHLFYTPSIESANQNDDGRLCLKLQEVFGPGLTSCKTAQSSFTGLPKDRFTHSTAYQYYSPLDSLSPFVAYATNTLCPPPATTSPEGSSCAARVDRLATASTLDISFDAAASSRDALKITAQWNLQDQPLVVTSSLDPSKHRVEVGVLASDPAQRGLAPHELGIAGLLTVLGQDKKPSTTVFKFPARHRRLPGAAPIFTADFLQPTGLHPTLQLKLSQEAIQPPPSPRSDDESNLCSLHAYLTLPRTVFADKYQLSDPLFLASKNLSALEYISQPVDLEAPDYVMDLWGSAVLLELLPPSSSSQWTAEVPLHLRYLAPAPGGYQDIEVPYPAVFWACSSPDKIPPSPFDKVRLGYDGLFPADTVFWHVDPYGKGARGQQEQRLTSGLRIPVLDTDKAGWVRAGTAAVVALGFGWLVWKLAQVYLATGYGPTKQMEGLEGRKKKGAEDKKTQ